MKRREFLSYVGGAAVAWPLGATAQQPAQIRRVGVLVTLTDDDLEGKARLTAFRQALQQLGWTDGRNLQLDVRWSAGDVERIRKNATDLAALAPDVIVASGNSTFGPLLQATRTVPVVFVTAADPVGAGYVDSLARPSGNATGFLARLQHQREMVGASQGDCSRACASGGHPQSLDTCCNRTVCRNPGRGAFARSRGECAQRARHWRDRERRHCLRARHE